MNSRQDFDPTDAQEAPLDERHNSPPITDEAMRGAARRVSDEDLLTALKNYRTDPENVLFKQILDIDIHSCIQKAVVGHLYRAPILRSFSDDLVQITWQRLLNQRKKSKSGQILADYDPHNSGGTCSVYAWVWRNVSFAVLDQLRIINKTRQVGSQFEVSLTEFEANEEDLSECAQMPRTPKELQISETPMKASYLRVTTLTPWLVTLASDMVGKQLTVNVRGETYQINFDKSHNESWLKWLALDDKSEATDKAVVSNLYLNELSEDKLADVIGCCTATLQLRTNEAYAYMLQHKDFQKKLDLMIPNRVRGDEVSEQDLRAKLLAMLHGPQGKVNFRKLVQAWVKTYYGV